MNPTRLRAVPAWLAVCLATAAPLASAQTTVVVAGVADAATGAPIEGAQVRLPDMGVIARTNWIGEATIKDVRRGTQRIQVRKLGYAPSDIQLVVRGDSSGPVFMLTRVTTLDTVRVAGQLYPARMHEFYSRQKLGIGRFLTDSVLAKEGHREINFVIATRFPGLRAGWDAHNHRFVLQSLRGPGSVPGNVIPPGINLTCPVDVYLDGMYYWDGVLEGLNPSDLAGVEMYPMTSAPPQYRKAAPIRSTRGAACAVLLLWSRF